jgi:outer membrane beta-barrel protein
MSGALLAILIAVAPAVDAAAPPADLPPSAASAATPAANATPAAQPASADAAKDAPRVEKASIDALPPMPSSQHYGAPGSLPPVSAQLFHIGGTLELMPVFSVSVGDAFWRTVSAGLRLEHHFDERWSISVHALGGVGLVDAPVDVCGLTACSAAAQAQLRAAPGKLDFLTGAQLGWAPIYGKLSVFGDYTIHFDAYVAAGPELVREVIAPDTTSPEAGRWAPGGRVSLGERVFLTNTFMIRLAASELVYSGLVRGSSQIERKLSFEGGVAWLFGEGR